MKKHSMIALAVLVGSSALAAGSPALYVRAKNTKLLAQPSALSKAVATLQPGDEVSWLARDAKNPLFHKVSTKGGQTGYLFQSNLATAKPPAEVHAQVAGNEAVRRVGGDASTGAATKALGDGAVSFKEQPEAAKVVSQLQAVDAIANRVDGKAIAAHVKSAGLQQPAKLATGGTP